MNGFTGGNNGNYTYTFTNGDASKIFEQFFGGSNPFGNMGNMGGINGMDIDMDSDGSQGYGNGINSLFGNTFARKQPRKRKGRTIKYDINLTLEDLYKGRIKTINITRKVSNKIY